MKLSFLKKGIAILALLVVPIFASAAVNVTATLQSMAHTYTPHLTSSLLGASSNKIVYGLDQQSAPTNDSYLAALSLQRMQNNTQDPPVDYSFSLQIGTDPALAGAQTFVLATGTLPATGWAATTGHTYDLDFDGLTPGTTYYFKVLDTKYNTSSPIISKKTTGTAPVNAVTPPVTPVVPVTSGAGSPTSPTTAAAAPSYTFAGLTLQFPLDEQILTETSIEIHGTVTADVDLPVDLSVLYAPAGAPFTNPQQLFSGTMSEGDSRDITVTIGGLTAGQSYYFAFRNAATNGVSAPLYFTAPGGSMNQTARFAGQRVGGNDAPPDIVFEDDISEEGIVPKCGRTAGPNTAASELRMCGYKDFLQLIANIINYGLIILGPIIAIYVMYAGAMIIILGKNPDPTTDVLKRIKGYWAVLVRIGVGVLIIALSWTMIATILVELGVKPNYILLDIISG